MNGRIFGFQRLVWWPKWTPASRRERSGRGKSPGAGTVACKASEATVSVMALSFRLVLRSPPSANRPDCRKTAGKHRADGTVQGVPGSVWDALPEILARGGRATPSGEGCQGAATGS